MNIWGEITGYAAGICTALCFLPQTIKTIITKNVRDLSFWSYLFYCLGILLWIIYGFCIGSVQMVLFNTFSVIFAGIILAMIIFYRHR